MDASVSCVAASVAAAEPPDSSGSDVPRGLSPGNLYVTSTSQVLADPLRLRCAWCVPLG